MARMQEEIRRVVAEAKDKVHIFPLCAACRRRTGLHRVRPDPHPDQKGSPAATAVQVASPLVMSMRMGRLAVGARYSRAASMDFPTATRSS